MDDTELIAEEPTALPLGDSIAPTATKLKADNSILTLLKVNNIALMHRQLTEIHQAHASCGVADEEGCPELKWTNHSRSP